MKRCPSCARAPFNSYLSSLTLWLSRFFGAKSALRGRALQLTRLAGLYVVPSPTQVLQNARALNLLLKHAQRCVDTVAVPEVDFNHVAYRPTLVTFSAAGPFWP